MSLAGHEERPVARPLHVLVPLIKKDLEQGDEASRQAGIPYYRAAGEKLLEARGDKDTPRMSLSELYGWSKRNFGISKTQTHRYMNLAISTADPSRSRQFASISEMERETGRDKRPSSGRVHRDYQPEIDAVIGSVNVELLNRRQAELKRVEERNTQKELALQLIDIGYKALATKLHPDKGGSAEAMTRLNQVRDWLKSFLAPLGGRYVA
jgi:hypothetical protein